MVSKEISLWQCGNARVNSEIYCAAGHHLRTYKGECARVPALKAKRGDPLIFKVCQGCPDLDYLGEHLKKSERGWLNGR